MDALATLLAIDAARTQAELDIFGDGHVRPESVTLKTHDRVSFFGGEIGYVDMVEKYMAFGGLLQTGDDSQQRGFPTPTGAKKKKQFAGGDLKVELPKRIHGCESFADFFERDARHEGILAKWIAVARSTPEFAVSLWLEYMVY